MSMREYAANSYGLVLTEKEATEFGKKYVQINDPKRYKDENWNEASADDFADNYDIFIYFSDFTGEATKIMTDGRDDWENSIMYNSDYFYVIELNYWPSLFSKAYESYEDLITSLNEAYGKYLPKDFNYEEHLRHVCGTVWG